MPWQRYMADVIGEYELVDGEVHLTYAGWDAATPRQSGKTVFSFSWLTHRATTMARRFGQLQQGLYVAQRGRDSAQKFEIDFCEMLRARPRNWSEVDRRPQGQREWRYTSANGKENMRIGPKGILYPGAPTRDVGHSKTLDVVLLDECFAFSLEEAEQIEAGVNPTGAARRSPQMGRISTAGDRRSTFWWTCVRDGRSAVESGARSSIAFFDWGVPDDVDPADEDAWWEFLPALGRTIPVEFLRAQLDKARRAKDPERSLKLFRRGYLNQWPEIPDLGGEKPGDIPLEAWGAAEDLESTMASRTAFGVDVAPNATSAAITAVARNHHGAVHMEIIDTREGVDWLEGALRRYVLRHRPLAVGWDAGGPAAVCTPDIERCMVGDTKALKLRGREWSAACEAFMADLMAGRLKHVADPLLDAAVKGAVKKPLAGAFIWDRIGGIDITPLCAMTAALRAFDRESHRIGTRSVYEDDDLTVA